MLPRFFHASSANALLAITTVSLLAGAATANENDPITITITGTRTAQTVDEALVPVKVISRDDIERSQAVDVEDLLTGQAGISLANTGGMGREGSLFIRGAESDHLVVLVDGIKINSATSGTAAIQNLPLDMIERVEIVRGPRASLYGADAIGGVIQFFTRRSQAGFSPSVALSYGSHNTHKVAANLAGRGEQGWYSLGVSQLKTDGFNACRGEANVGGCFTNEPDDDGYENQSFSLAGGMAIGERTELSLNAMQADSEVEFDGDFVNRAENLNTTLGGKLKVAVREGWNATLAIGQSKDESDNYKDAVFGSTFDAQRDSLSLQNDVQLGKGLLTIGIDQNEESVDGTTQYSQTERDNTGVFVQLQQPLSGASDLAVSLRNDDHSDFGAQTTGNLALGHQLANGKRLTAAYGTAFKAPSFNELYFPDFGNPNLQAETAKSWDLGIRDDDGQTRWAVNLFQTRTDNLIAYDAAAGLPVNIGETRTQGVEVVLGRTIASWAIDTALTHLKTENRSADNEGKHLPRRPEMSLRLDANRTFGAFSLGGSLRAQGKSYDDLANTRELASFTTLDLKLGYAMAPAWQVQLAVNNVFDEEYETAEYYNQDGINGMLTLRYQPQNR